MGNDDSMPNGIRVADSAGLFASIACAIHCAAMPLVIGYLPLLGLEWLANESFHQVMAVVCFTLALSAFWPGWRTHGSLAPGVVGSVGVAMLTLAAFGLEGECCPTCTAPETVTASSQVTCVDTECSHCVTETAPAVAESTPPEILPALAWTVPLMTPFGGLLLVAGHVTNHRKLCGCRAGDCCHGDRDGSDQAVSAENDGAAG